MDTVALHGGHSRILDMTAVRLLVPPIYIAASFPINTVDQYTRIIEGAEPGYSYGRTINPTVDVLQMRLAIVEGGEAAVATPSGMHACFAVAIHLTKAGEEVVTTHKIFGNAYNMFFRLLPEHMGITTRLVENPSDLDEWERKITSKTRFLWAETPSNPTLDVTDIVGLARIAHAHNILLVVDSTLATPCLLQHLPWEPMSRCTR